MRILALANLAILGAFAQQLPDGKVLIDEMGKGSGRFHTVQYANQFVMETTTPNGPQKVTFESAVVRVNPGKMRTESKVPGATFIMVSDGDTTTVYTSLNKEYVRVPAALGPGDVMKAMGMSLPDMSQTHVSYQTLREETVEVDGVPHLCNVVEGTFHNLEMELPQNPQMKMKIEEARMTHWIDRKLGLGLKMDVAMSMQVASMPSMSLHQTMLIKDLKLDEPVADSVFAFTPPEGAKEVKEMSIFSALVPKSEMVGKDAPAFDIKGVDGKSYSLAALKGKPVLLDFWATWCGPCRKSSPIVEKLYREYKERGLTIIGVDVGEERSVVEAFLKKNPMAYPSALSGDSGIQEAYKVKAYPTFVLIGSDGKVAAEEIGFSSEDVLRGMLPKAGLAK
ncbi:MAG TPA: redoxin family protein [Bryobacteraceae bacterium]|nr:redoxin family protein [Bryobacteraceae bacterium]